MPLPVPNLDDRRFDELVAEAQARLHKHLPELTQIAPGDPANAFIDLFAWLTETILFRANLIPERQRRVFLNLLQLPLRPAQPARGVVCIDAGKRTTHFDALVAADTELKAGDVTLTTCGEVRPTSLLMAVMIKERLSPDALREAGISLEALKAQYGKLDGEPTPFRPRTLTPGMPVGAPTPMSLTDSIDKAYYLAFAVPRPLVDQAADVRSALAGVTLNVAVAPADDQLGDQESAPPTRTLRWELAHREADGSLYYLPLETVGDSSYGGRVAGVARLRLPHQAGLFQPLIEDDPLYAGYGARPPEPPESFGAEQLLFWLRLSCPEEPDLALGYLGVNGVEVAALGTRQDVMLDPGTGQPDQVVALG
ncbi:MAG: putative baseplate assembly protein, partial [Gammaproteobacteria bacterium]